MVKLIMVGTLEFLYQISLQITVTYHLLDLFVLLTNEYNMTVRTIKYFRKRFIFVSMHFLE